MKLLFLLISLSCCAVLPAQNIVIDNCGNDAEPLLNTDEAMYFNTILKKQRGDFDFQQKRIVFVAGNYGKKIRDKAIYFELDGKPRWEKNHSVSNQLLILDESEKELLPDYDAIIISWSKLAIKGKHRRKLIQRIRKNL